LEVLKSYVWDVHIADEVHRIKNKDSKRSKAMKQIPSSRHIGLTGTPILNKPNDLWSILEWLDKRYSGRSYWNFVERFCQIEESFFGNQIVGLTKNEANVARLKQLMDLVSVSNPDLDLTPGKDFYDIKIPFTSPQKTMYKKVQKLILDELPENLTIANGMAKSIRLRQLCSNPDLFDVGPNLKFEWIADQLEDNPDIKMVIYSWFAETIKALNKFLLDKNIGVATIYGAIKDRQTEKKKFIEDPECRVMTGTISAVGEGTDGLQHSCSMVVFIDRDWSPKINEQAEDRVNRMGQNKKVGVYYLVCSGSIEEKIGRINIKKAEDIWKVLGVDKNEDT
jgi:SNF2 family DNA or RNA helicase